MKATSSILLATATLGSAQIIKNGNGTYTCALPSGAYCVSTSLESNMIIRCNNGIGQVSSCDDRLSDKAPLGISYSPCWQTSTISGNAQCSKNGIIYPDGNNTTPYPVPNYQTISASISSAATATTGATKWPYISNFTTRKTTSTDADASVTLSPYLPYLPAVVAPTSTQYTTDIPYKYTTTYPAGATITNSAGVEAVLVAPSTITLTSTTRSTITATAIVSLASPIFAIDASSVEVASAYAPIASPATAPYAWNNATWGNATRVIAMASAAPIASDVTLASIASASASSDSYPVWNQTVVQPYTGAAGKIGISLAAAFLALVLMI